MFFYETMYTEYTTNAKAPKNNRANIAINTISNIFIVLFIHSYIFILFIFPQQLYQYPTL